MALEKEVAPIHISHWGLEDSLSTPLKGWTDGDENENGAPTRDIATSDEATSASALDTKMIMDHEYQHGESSNVSRQEIVDRHETPRVEGGTQASTMATMNGQPASEPQESSSSVNPSLEVPTPVFTLRRSPRHSTPVSQNGPANKELAQIIASSSARASPLARMVLPKPDFPTTSATPFNIFSTPLPSPSIFQSRTSSPFPAQYIQEFDVPPPSSPQSEASGYGAAAQSARLQLNSDDSPPEGPQNLAGETENTDSRDVEMSDVEKHPSGRAPSSTTPIKFTFFNEKSHESPQFADVSSIFASPMPTSLPPVLSPLRHQSLQETDTLQLSHAADSTALNTATSIQDAASHSQPILSPIGSPFPASKTSFDPISTPERPIHTLEEASKEDLDEEEEDVYRTIMTPSQRADRNAAVMVMQVLRSPERTSPKGLDLGKDSTTSTLDGPLAPPTSPGSPSRLPYPITPQRIVPLGFVPIFPLSFIGVPSQVSGMATTPVRTVQGIASRLPVAVSTPILTPSTSFLPLSPRGASTPVNNDSQHFPALSPFRQPSALKSAITGAASKIPRPGKKPYSKPISRLPRPQALVKPANPAPSVLSPPPAHPKHIFSPPAVNPAPISPIKTRRGRANASQATTSTSVPMSAGLPPGIIVHQPPAPRIRENIAPATISIPPEPTGDEIDTVAPVQPPISTDTKISPKSGIGLPKPRTKRTKPEVDKQSPAIPEFGATAPSLGIFPSQARGSKARGRTGVARPMMLPLDPTSLRHLTNSNTLRNQQYVCSMVQTKIIMKEGNRPESPTTRVKTLLEKKKEQGGKSREERAARRDANYPQGADQEMEDAGIDGNKKKHPRAAGDDEDYETPVKVRREPDSMEVDEENDRPKKKRVQWKVDLLQRFELDPANLDGIKKGAEAARLRAAERGCFAAKVILDPLGNVPDADVPIPDLPREQVTVTRLVYIDDLPPSERPKRAVTTKAGPKGASS
ncbi:hypothetical protein FRB91_008975 [Serendipita sp. 411]|nr:hypothetical protein FRB91_008975 [Serendipita sp. 411]